MPPLPMSASRRSLSAVAVAAVVLAGCASATLGPATTPPALEISAAARSRADDLLRRAAAHEPTVTARLQLVAEELGLRLWSLEHRLKSRESLERKLETTMLETGVAVDRVVIDDALRYTLLVEDEPAGHYDAAVAEVLRRLESDGFPVLEVKNYWPPEDIYSGVNCVLATVDGLRWELQFHTIGSVAAKSEGHDLYEEFRLPQTPIKRKRRIFDRLRERWSWVEIPSGVLVEHSLHAKEEILFRGRP